jgi:hypothetical protein
MDGGGGLMKVCIAAITANVGGTSGEEKKNKDLAISFICSIRSKKRALLNINNI